MKLRSRVAFTPLFRSAGGGMEQVARLTIEADAHRALAARATTGDGRSTVTPLSVEPGTRDYEIAVPEVAAPGEVELRLLDGAQAVAMTTARCNPARKWTVFVMPTSHIDLYSTALAHQTPAEHARILDAVVGLAEEFADYHYQVENMLPLFEYPELRPAAAVSRLADLIRSGRVGFGAQFTGVHHEEASAEELVQGQLLMLRALERAHGIRPNCGYTVDVPNTTLQYPQLLARCGVPYWIFSPNRFPPPDGWYGLGPSLRRLPRLFRARAPDGSAVLTWLPHEHYGEDQKRFGLDRDDLDAAARHVAACLQELEEQGYPRDAYLLEHSYGDNLPPTRALPAFIAAWRSRYAFPRLVLATADQFFRHVDDAAGDVPELRLQVLDVWAWIVASQGVLNPIARRAGCDLLRAQALWAVRNGAAHPEAEFRQAFSDLAKFAAHDWFYGGGLVAGIPDLAKAAWANQARALAANTLERALDGASPTTAFNPCAFARRDILVAAADAAMSARHEAAVEREGRRPCQAVDAATRATHFRLQPFSTAHPPAGEDHEDAVAATADFPALGFAGIPPRRPAVHSRRHRHPVLENAHYRVAFDASRGAVASIVDRASGRELVDADPYGFGQLLLGSPQLDALGIGFGGSLEQATESMRQSLTSWTPYRLQLDHGLHGPVFSSLLLRGTVHASPATQAIIAYEDIPRIDVAISIDWDNEPPGARLVAAFPFALHPFTCRYEVPFGTLAVGRDETATTPRHLRQLQSWLQFESGTDSAVLASPDVGVFSLGRCDLDPIDDGEHTVPHRPAAFFILADNGAPSPLVQPGRLAVRFSLTSGRGLRPSDCARFAWGCARPPVAVGDAACAAHGVEVSPDSLLVSVVKRAWDGSGLVVRVVEYDGVAADAALRLPFTPRRAWLADPVERPQAPAEVADGAVRFTVRPHEIATLLIEGPLPPPSAGKGAREG